MNNDPKLLRIFFTMMLCFAIGSLIMCVDLHSVPKRDKFKPIMGVHEKRINQFEQERRFWEWNLGNGYVSASEHAIMLLCLFFGFMRTIDLNKRFKEIEKERAWVWFWNVCENNAGDNNY